MRQLLIIGDSIMKGVMNDDGKYRLCHDHDFSSLTANEIQVDNASKMGATIESIQPVLKKKLAGLDEQSTVLFSLGGNDCDYDWSKISEDPDGTFEPHTPNDRFLSLYRDAIRAAQDTGAKVAVASILPLDSERYFDFITKGRDRGNILHWLGDVNHLYRWQEYYNSLVCTLARVFGCRLVDLRSRFLCRSDFPSLLSCDGIHPSQQGHDLIHTSVAAALG